MVELFYEDRLRDLIANIIEDDGFDKMNVQSGEDLSKFMVEVCIIIRDVFCDTANDNDLDGFESCI